MQVSSSAFCLGKTVAYRTETKFPIFTMLLLGNTQIRMFSRGRESEAEEKEESFCGGKNRERKKGLGREEMWHGLAMKGC